MSVETYTATVFGERVTCLRDPQKYPVLYVRGDYMTKDGFIDRRAVLALRVTPDGRAWTTEQKLIEAEDVEVACERWGDGDLVGINFLADKGELDRCGIVPKLRGSAAGE